MISAKISAVIFVLSLSFAANFANAQVYTEGFETFPPQDWKVKNNSSPTGSLGWHQGDAAIFPAHQGSPNSYAVSDINSTNADGTISNWLISPNFIFRNGDQIKFWTRTIPSGFFSNRMQVRFSSAGDSTDVGTTPTSVGVFTSLFMDINPTFDNYPASWVEFTLTISGLSEPTSGRIAFRHISFNADQSNLIAIDTFSHTPGAVPSVPRDAPVDFDGDGKSDWVVARNIGGGANGQMRWFWSINGAANSFSAADWGLASDVFVPEDYDGDDKDDLAVWRTGAAGTAAFYILQSATNTIRAEPFGQTGDDPTIVDDFSGDGKADLAVYRTGNPSVWYFRSTPGSAITFVPWGQAGDVPASGDFDDNGRADFCVRRNVGGNGQFWIKHLNGNADQVINFGLATDRVVPGDYNGDARTDIAVVRTVGDSLVWYWRPSVTGSDQQIIFGKSTDFPAQGDYDGDGKTDIAVWQPSAIAGQSAFWVRNSTGGTITTFVFGTNGDFPAANYNTH